MMSNPSWECSDWVRTYHGLLLWDKRHMFTTQTFLQHSQFDYLVSRGGNPSFTQAEAQIHVNKETKSGVPTWVQHFSFPLKFAVWSTTGNHGNLTSDLIESRWASKLHFHLNGNSPNLPFRINHLSPVTAGPRPPSVAPHTEAAFRLIHCTDRLVLSTAPIYLQKSAPPFNFLEMEIYSSIK